MHQALTILLASLAVMAVMGAGAVCRRARWLRPEADDSLIRVTVHLLLPCLIFHSVATTSALRDRTNVWMPPAFGFISVCLGMLAALAFARLTRGRAGLDTPAQRRTFALSVGLYNYGYLPVPLMELLFGAKSGAYAVLFVHNVGVELALWTAGLFMLSGGVGKGWVRRLLNPPAIALLLAIPLNVLDGTAWVPKAFLGAVKMIGDSSIPMGLMLAGATIHDRLTQDGLRGGGRVITAACLLRLGVLPLFFLAAARWLPVSDELRRVILVQAAMPAAIIPIVLARQYQGDVTTALRVSLGTNLLALAVTPLSLSLGLWWIGISPEDGSPPPARIGARAAPASGGSHPPVSRQ